MEACRSLEDDAHETYESKSTPNRGVDRQRRREMVMRWWVVVVILLTPLFSSLVPAAAQPASNTIMEVVAEPNVVIHRDETITTYVTVHNTAEVAQTVTVEAASNITGLSVMGLPASQVMAANHLHQFTFEVMASVSAPFQSTNLTLRLIGDADQTLVLFVNMSVLVAPYSNLSWGVNGVSQFTVDETVRTSVAVNMTNDANLVDNVTFSLFSPSSWTWGWNMETNPQGHAMLNLSQGQTGYVYLWVDVPAVVDGAPLAGTGPRFTLTGVSGIDREAHIWEFDLLMNEKRNVSIDRVDTNLTLSPDQNGRIEITVRNVGNTVNTLNMSLLPVDEEEQPVDGRAASDRFNVSGWTVALFGGLEDVPLAPNESRVIEVGIQAPNDLSGELRVKMLVFARGATALRQEAVVSATIQRATGAELELQHQGCTGLNEANSCTVQTVVTNTGNSYNSFTVRSANITNGFNSNVTGTDGGFFLPNQEKALASFTFTSRSELLAFTSGSVDIEVVDDTGDILTSRAVNLRVSPRIRWNLTVVEETVDERGRLSMAFEVRNDGNAEDGLLVQLQSSHAVSMSLVPPEGALYEDGVLEPRSIELGSIPIGSTFTLRAWAQLPQDQTSNGTVYINTTLRSRYTPEDTFLHTTQADYLGTPWQQEAEDGGANAWSEGLALSVAYLKAWSGVLVATGVSVGLVVYALKARRQRQQDQSMMPYQQVDTTADDWMAKFNQPTTDTTPSQPSLPSPTVSKEEYQRRFRQEHGHARAQQAPVEPQLVDAAQLVLERGTEERGLQKANELLRSVTEGHVAKPVQNLSLNNPTSPQAEAESGLSPVLEQSAQPWDDDLDF